MDFRSRIRKLQRLSGRPALVSNPNDIFYYTGYRPGTDDSPLLIVPARGKPTLFLSPLTTGVKPYAKVETFDSLSLPQEVGYDEYHLPARLYLRLRRKSRLIRAAETIKKPREIKSPEEVSLMKKAVSINKKALEAVTVYGKSEMEAAREIDLSFYSQKAEPAFETIVSSGSNAGNHIHHIPGSRKVKRGGMVIVDFGSRWKGYSSDVTRTFFRGEKQRKIVEAVRQLQVECIDMAKPGIHFKEINGFYAKRLEKLGHEARHGIGHGIGIFVHEPAEVLKKGMVVTIEPGIYIRGFGGCRIEDMVLVAKRPVVLSGSIPQEVQ